MSELRNNTHFVLKMEDIRKFLTIQQLKELDSIIRTIEAGRRLEGKSATNTYHVCNLDEPYSDEVLQSILNGESKKALWDYVCNKMRALDIPSVSFKMSPSTATLSKPDYIWEGEQGEGEDYFYFKVALPSYSPDNEEDSLGYVTCRIEGAYFNEKYDTIKEFDEVMEEYELFLRQYDFSFDNDLENNEER